MVIYSRLVLSLGLAVVLSFCLLPMNSEAEMELNVEDLAEVTFTNYLDWSIYYLFISPSDSEYYGGDVMDTTGALILDPYNSILLYMTPGEFDVLILDEDFDMWLGTFTVADGDEVEFSELSLDYQEYGVSDALIYIDIWVEVSYSVEYLFLSPSDSDHWGADLLGMTMLEPDDILPITLLEYDTTKDYDLLVIYEDGEQFTMAVEAADGTDVYLSRSAPGDDDDVVDDDDDIVDDDDVVDDDDDIVDDDDVVDDDDDDDNTGPGGISGGGGEGLEGDDDDTKKTNALGIFAIIATSVIFIGVRWIKRKE